MAQERGGELSVTKKTKNFHCIEILVLLVHVASTGWRNLSDHADDEAARRGLGPLGAWGLGLPLADVLAGAGGSDEPISADYRLRASISGLCASAIISRRGMCACVF